MAPDQQSSAGVVEGNLTLSTHTGVGRDLVTCEFNKELFINSLL